VKPPATLCPVGPSRHSAGLCHCRDLTRTNVCSMVHPRPRIPSRWRGPHREAQPRLVPTCRGVHPPIRSPAGGRPLRLPLPVRTSRGGGRCPGSIPEPRRGVRSRTRARLAGGRQLGAVHEYRPADRARGRREAGPSARGRRRRVLPGHARRRDGVLVDHPSRSGDLRSRALVGGRWTRRALRRVRPEPHCGDPGPPG